RTAHRPPTRPPAVTGGPVRAYLERVARAPFGRRLGEDVRGGPAAGLAPSPARSGWEPPLLVPVIASNPRCYTDGTPRGPRSRRSERAHCAGGRRPARGRSDVV